MARLHAKLSSVAPTLVVALLVGTLAACGGGGEDNAASDPTTTVSPTAGTSPTVDPSESATSVPSPSTDPEASQFDYCKDPPSFTGPAADEFSAAEVTDAYCTFVTLEMEQSFVDEYLRADDPDMTVQDFSVWRDYMTKETADEWDATVAKALAGDKDAKQDVWSLTWYNMVTGSGYAFVDGEPSVLNTDFTPADADVDTAGGENRLVLAFNVIADLNVLKDGEPQKPLLIRLDRRIVFALVRNPVPDDEKTDWLIDSWTGKFTIGKPKRRGPLPSATP